MRENRLTNHARQMRHAPTDAEARMWRLLRDRRFQCFKFRRQHQLGYYIVDFVCLEQRLVIEIDGGQHAESRRDAARDAWLSSRGFAIQRFWNIKVLSNPTGVQHVLATRLGIAWLP